MAERRSVSRDAVPKVSFEVRRRRYGNRRWLVRHNDVYELDALGDAVWLACAEGLTIEEIVHRVAEQAGLPTARALEATTAALRRFDHLGLVELDEAD